MLQRKFQDGSVGAKWLEAHNITQHINDPRRRAVRQARLSPRGRIGDIPAGGAVNAVAGIFGPQTPRAGNLLLSPKKRQETDGTAGNELQLPFLAPEKAVVEELVVPKAQSPRAEGRDRMAVSGMDKMGVSGIDKMEVSGMDKLALSGNGTVNFSSPGGVRTESKDKTGWQPVLSPGPGSQLLASSGIHPALQQGFSEPHDGSPSVNRSRAPSRPPGYGLPQWSGGRGK